MLTRGPRRSGRAAARIGALLRFGYGAAQLWRRGGRGERRRQAGRGSRRGPGPLSAGAERHSIGLATVAREWLRIGCIGFGGPPAHIALLRKLCVEQRGWLTAEEFEDGVATTNLLPGPASTQLAMYCAWRLAGPAGVGVGGACFILPGLAVILGLAVFFLAAHPPAGVAGAAGGAGAAVPAVAAAAAIGLMPASWRRAGSGSAWPRITAAHWRWIGYLIAGGVAGGLAGTFLVLVLAACGLTELAVRWPRAGRQGRDGRAGGGRLSAIAPLALAVPAAAGGLLAVAWVAFKVGALSYGGGFVIIPLMQHDAVHTYHWMSGPQFLSAVALGQVTPGPVVQTVAVVGYAAAGIGGGLLASLVAFSPSFAFVLGGAPYFAALRRNAGVQAFLTGAGPAAIGAIAGSTVPLGLELTRLWQAGVLALAVLWLLVLRRNVVAAIVGAACLGAIAVLAGAPAP
jgi:chromate transporter